ncbi:MAG TPA: fumarate hydratase [Syntrophorhabdales bacterium]|nr:fumarate hydratase [Syntrophorhabdales bacterium]
MREVQVDAIRDAVEKLFIEANYELPEDVIGRFKDALGEEESPVGREVIEELLLNARIARDERIPICQDTGLAILFMEIGQDVHITGGDLEEAATEGVCRAYKKGYLRKSACDPFTRTNTGDNTPPILHVRIAPGERIRLIAMPKGGGSENYSEVRMLTPSEGAEGVKRFVLEMVQKAGPNPCPPITVGIGIGGNFETSALLSKEALMLPFGKRNNDPLLRDLELSILGDVNKLGIGPEGYGGSVTALDLHIKARPCHIASLPVAVNIQCHAHRIKEATI